MKSSVEFQWWSLSDETESGTDEVPASHREALEQTAIRVIADRTAQGYVEGDLHEKIHEAEDESDDGVNYRGYWKLVRSA